MRQTLRRSCAACARSKHSCDLRTPRCSRCLKRNVQCLYANEPLTASPVSSDHPGREEAWASRPSSSPSALTTYRFGSLDPFDSYPQTRLPRAQVQRLIHSYEELLAQKGFQSSEVLMVDSVALLRRKVEDLSLAVQDGTLNSVITLATIEYGKGNIEVSHTHVEGVKRLVQLRGGINAVRQTSPLTARMVSWASMLIMGHPQFETQDDAGIGDGIPPIPEWQLEPVGLDDGHVDLAPYEIDYAVSNVVGRLRSVFRQAEQVHFSTTRLHDLTCFVVHRLLRTSPDPPMSAPSPMSQCLRYATALYMFIIQGPTYYPHTVIMGDVIRKLIENREQLDPSPFDIWIFTIGLAASVGTAQYQWFLERARAAATSLQLREWSHGLYEYERLCLVTGSKVLVIKPPRPNLLQQVADDEVRILLD
ncbi:C6 zinc finger domain-containing protein [Verticillium dahliae VdLs.17]|uniref:C6 zinc finger domain-containing protein n=1 Tax=Verticillium dahliae (strain VdLs.17 / ATCC MYA-4575 / FGSC 10137) TaxID=498257 RepID=G2XE93_VERDV|nr:C6 zinc finger domain-containing protein [Verticillium dahliae VdLs.17]EGY18141.1 C6 zinc finger domain-containing protein [Verticillium dahliae VdLs.17]